MPSAVPSKCVESTFTFLLSSFWFTGPLEEEYGCFPVNPQSIFGKHSWKVNNKCSTVPPSNIVSHWRRGRWGTQIPEPGGMRETFQAGFTVGKKKGASLLSSGHHDVQSRDVGSEPQIWTLLFLWLRNTPYLFRDFVSLSAECDKRDMNSALPP